MSSKLTKRATGLALAGLMAFAGTFALAGQSARAEEVRKSIAPAGAAVIAPYSPAIDYKGGLLFVSGNIAYVDGAIPAYAVDGKDDVQDQTKIVMESLGRILAAAGYSFDDALKVTVFLSDIAHYSAFNEVYGTYWQGEAKPPAREAVQVAALPGNKPGAPVLLEVSLIAGK